MSCYRQSMPPSDWPEEIRTRFEEIFAEASLHQRPRLEQGLGRWLLDAERDNLPPELITPDLLVSRADHLRSEMAGAMRQALQAVFPEANVFAKTGRVAVESKRAALSREIDRNWHRLPAAWQEAARAKLHFCPEGLKDGILVEAWSVSSLQSRLQSAWAFFDFCRDQGFPEDVIRETVQKRLDERQKAFKKGDMSIATVCGEIQRLKLLGLALFPQRDWSWLDPVLTILKKKAELQPSRNDARLVDLAELRIAATSCSEVALRRHKSATSFKAKTSANKLARTGLAISLLVNSPIRRESLATLDLQENFDSGLTKLYLTAQETKDKKQDERFLTPELQQHLRDYVEYHRTSVAPLRETALFVGSRGKPVGPGYLSQTIGDQCQKLFGKRVTPQVIRNIIAGFIVSQAPEQAALATVVLNHSTSAMTESYRASGNQVKAAQKLREANDKGRETFGVVGDENSTGRAKRKPLQRRHTRRSKAAPSPMSIIDP